MKLKQGVLITSITVALAACGTASTGDSGSESGNDSSVINTSAINESPLQITTSNSRDIATRGVGPSQSLEKDTDPTDYLNSDPRTRLAAKTVTSAFLKTDGFSMKATETNKADCDVSGTMELSIKDANDNGEADNGDSMTLDYDSCVSGYGSDTSSVDGRVVIRFAKFSAESEEIDISIDFDAITTVSGSDKSVLDGDIGFSSSNSNGVTSMTIEGDKFAFSNNDEIGKMQDFGMTITMNESTQAWTQKQNAIYAGTDIDGKIIVETLTTMQGIGTGNPTIGKVKVSGANGSYMMIDADSGNASTLILTTYDGSSMTSEELNWSELE